MHNREDGDGRRSIREVNERGAWRAASQIKRDDGGCGRRAGAIYLF